MNSGKRFEANFKASVPKDIFYYRFRDGSSAWDKGTKTRFQQKNICDCMIFDGERLLLLELKSTKGKSLPFSNIKKHQIEDLTKCSEYANTICGFVIEFADLDECYFLEISQFNEFLNKTSRKSLDIDFVRKNAIKIVVEKKKVNRRFNIKELLGKLKIGV